MISTTNNNIASEMHDIADIHPLQLKSLSEAQLESSSQPLVFQCIKCNVIIGDNLQQMNADKELNTITLCAASNIKRVADVFTSKSGHDVGCTYLMCSLLWDDIISPHLKTWITLGKDFRLKFRKSKVIHWGSIKLVRVSIILPSRPLLLLLLSPPRITVTFYRLKIQTQYVSNFILMSLICFMILSDADGSMQLK